MARAPLYSGKDRAREISTPPRPGSAEYRSEFRRDYGRLVHSPAFRRLQGKTQLFPGTESDFFRNRLTHSIEVAQIAKSIALRLNASNFKGGQTIDCDLVEVAALAHDLGHPPFGHNGEKALDDCMKVYGGFEGNAQTLRILARLEKRAEGEEKFSQVADADGRDRRVGLNLTYRTLAAVLKYDHEIARKRRKGSPLEKGYYCSEKSLVDRIKRSVAPGWKAQKPSKFKTIECSIMDTADDIAYSTYDFEDALKAGFVSPLRLLSTLVNNPGLVDRIAAKANRALPVANSLDRDGVISIVGELLSDVIYDDATTKTPKNAVEAYDASQRVATNGYVRSEFTAGLVNRFLGGVCIVDGINTTFPALTVVDLEPSMRRQVEVLKHLTYEVIIMSPRLKVVEFRGYELVKTIFETLHSEEGHLLLPDDFRQTYESFPNTDERARLISDFVAGMTDLYALEFHARLKQTGQSIFKPL